MVVASTVFVIRDDQQSAAPGWSVVHGPVGVQEQLLAQSYVVIGMLTVSVGGPAGFEERIRGQCPGGGIGPEIGNNPK